MNNERAEEGKEKEDKRLSEIMEKVEREEGEIVEEREDLIA